MNAVAARRPSAIRGDQLEMLMRRLQQYAGIRIDSSRGVIAGCIEQRMNNLGLQDVDSYMSAFDDSINARAEWLALIDLLTVKETQSDLLIDHWCDRSP